MLPRLTFCFLFLKLITTVTAAPVENSSIRTTTEKLDCDDENSDLYDQRQNGTENYRIHVNGVVVLVAPAETVLQAAQLGTLQLGSEPDTNVLPSQPLKPKPRPPAATDKVPTTTGENTMYHPKDSKDKNNLKLLNLLHMFRSIKHDSK